jgi:hypothetical protein
MKLCCLQVNGWTGDHIKPNKPGSEGQRLQSFWSYLEASPKRYMYIHRYIYDLIHTYTHIYVSIHMFVCI